MKKINQKRKIASILCGFLSLFLVTQMALSQNQSQVAKKITGRIITISDGKPIAGVTVLIKGTSVGTQTDANGEFTINAKEKNILLISFVGYTSQEISVGKKSRIDVKILEDDSKQLSDVVVIGYGKVLRKDATGAISSLSAADIAKGQPTTIDQALQGKIAGVVVQQVSGQPGGGVSIQIRGLSSFSDNPPLYVIDGVIIPPNAQSSIPGNGTNPLSSINPSEIASVDILKDASATAIYGSQATNGVIVITTKRGQINTAPKVSYDMYLGQQQLPKYYSVMNLRDYATFMNAKSAIIGYDLRPQFTNPQYLGEGTNWQKALFRTAPMQNHTIGVSGGDSRTQYFFSGTYFSQDGIALGSDFKRMSMRLNLDNKTTNWLKTGVSLQLANVKENVATSNTGVIRQALIQTPDVNVVNPDGSWGGNDPNIYGATSSNPFALATINKDLKKRYQVFGNVYAEIALTKDLSFRNEVSGNFDFGVEDQFSPTYRMGTITKTVSSATYQSAQNFYYSVRNYLTYTHLFNKKYNVNALMGHEAQLGTNESVSASRNIFPSNNVQALNSGDPTTATNSGNKGQYSQESYFGRLNFTYNDKYLLTANVRADGSSKFSADGRWVTTYSGAFKWRLEKETFLKNVTVINELSLRLGYGLTNNQNIRDYAYGSTLNTVATSLSGISQLTATTGNPFVKWETTKSYNVGMDGSILNRRIEFSFDYYQRTTNNLLLSLTLPLYSGTVDATGYAPGSIQSPYINIGSVSNQGFDLSFSTINIRNKNFFWKTSIVVSHNTNKVLSLNTAGASLLGYAGSTVVALTTAGRSIGEFYGYQTDGLFKTAQDFKSHPALPQKGGLPIPITNGSGGVWLGDVMFKDINGDGVIDERDQTYLGSPRPTYQIGFNNSFTFKNFDLNIFISGNFGNKIFNQLRTLGDDPNQNFGYFKSVLNFSRIGMIDPAGLSTDINNVKIINPESNITRVSQASGNSNGRFSDRFMEDGSFLRCKNISLGYTFATNLLAKIHVNAFRVYANVSNVFTITKYTGYDPEIGSYNPLAAGIDNGYYAQARIITIGANLSFNK